KVRHHAPDPMGEEFYGHIGLVYPVEVFDCYLVLGSLKSHITGGNLPNGFRLSRMEISRRFNYRFTNSNGTDVVEHQHSKPSLAEPQQPRARQILIRRLPSRTRDFQYLPKLAEPQQDEDLATKGTEMRCQVAAPIRSGEYSLKYLQRFPVT